jgi:hypothetical protein
MLSDTSYRASHLLPSRRGLPSAQDSPVARVSSSTSLSSRRVAESRVVLVARSSHGASCLLRDAWRDVRPFPIREYPAVDTVGVRLQSHPTSPATRFQAEPHLLTKRPADTLMSFPPNLV